LGRYLFGPRWQIALSQRLGVSRQIVGYWARSERPVSRRYSEQLAEIVGQQHERRARRERSRYRAMVESLNSPDARQLMLAMLAAEIEVRVSVVTQLAQPGTLRPGAQPPAVVTKLAASSASRR
jgi:hypothetical protein